MSQSAPALASARFDADAEAKLSALRRTKFVATAALALLGPRLAVAKSFGGRFAWLGFVAAFVAETLLNGTGG